MNALLMFMCHKNAVSSLMVDMCFYKTNMLQCAGATGCNKWHPLGVDVAKKEGVQPSNVV